LRKKVWKLNGEVLILIIEEMKAFQIVS